MRIAYPAYKFLTSCLFLAGFPIFSGYSRITGRFQDAVSQRLGYYPPELTTRGNGNVKIWIHAVSVGEVKAAVPIIESLNESLPGATVVVSTTTERGRIFAGEILDPDVATVYVPVDYIGAVRRALSSINPHILVLLETEIWPNLLVEAHRRGIKTAIVNGRISVRTIRNYLKIKPLIHETLDHVDAFSMISEEDAERIMKLGASRRKITIGGNSKFDMKLSECDSGTPERIRRRYAIAEGRKVIVAGSTRRSEEDIILSVYDSIRRDFPDTVLIIAPRHVERAGLIADSVKAQGYSCQFRTDLDRAGVERDAQVVIIDTIGELRDIYSIATIAFCGGSLVPLGGQNVLEPALWGRPVVYGPSMEDFLEAKHLLEKWGGGIPVSDGPDMAQKLLYYLNHSEEAEHVGKMARLAVMQYSGAAQRHARVICGLVSC